MARIAKTLLRTGIFQAPQGELVATPKRLQHWVKQFRKMKQAGIRVPAAWGHQPQAEPGDADDRAKKQYYLSAYNAGYIDDLEFNPATGRLRLIGDIPGAEVDDKGNLITEHKLPDGSTVKSAIGEVSAAIKDWRDGSGKVWKDSIIHVALTPLPVVAGQDGFRALSTLTDGDAICLSLSTRLRSLSTDDETDEGDMAEDRDDDMDLDTEGGESAEGGSEGGESEGGSGGKSGKLKKVLEYLAEHGIHLPPDTSEDNLAERLEIVGHDHSQAGEAEGEGEEEGETPTGEDMGGEEEGGGSAPTSEEQRPVLMSTTSGCRTQLEQRLLEREETRRRKDLAARLQKCIDRGMPVAKANKLRERISGYTLSMTTEGEVMPKKVEAELAIWEEALPKKGKFTKRTLSSVTEEPRPALAEDKPDDADIKARAERVSTFQGRHHK